MTTEFAPTISNELRKFTVFDIDDMMEGETIPENAQEIIYKVRNYKTGYNHSPFPYEDDSPEYHLAKKVAEYRPGKPLVPYMAYRNAVRNNIVIPEIELIVGFEWLGDTNIIVQIHDRYIPVQAKEKIIFPLTNSYRNWIIDDTYTSVKINADNIGDLIVYGATIPLELRKRMMLFSMKSRAISLNLVRGHSADLNVISRRVRNKHFK
jgi:hypothetical protein